MATTPMYDPLSSEARSPWLAGLTEACAKLSTILNMGVDSFSDLTLQPVDNNYLIYQAPLGDKLWLNSPAPVIRKNGIVIDPITDNFTINYLGGSVEFDRQFPLTQSDVITADATYVIDSSNTITNILNELSKLQLTAGQFKGYFPDVATMEAALGNGVAGNYVLIGGTENTFYLWNSTTQSWEKSYKEPNWSDYYTVTQVDNLLDDKENTIVSAFDLGYTNPENYYFNGYKSWTPFVDTLLFSEISVHLQFNPDPIGPNDNFITVISKINTKIDSYIHDLFGTSDPTTTTAGEIGQDYTNVSTGAKYHLVEKNGNDYIWKQYQDKLNFDSVPTAGSNNILTSGTIYDELQDKANTSTVTNGLAGKADKVIPSSVGNIATLDATGNLVDSGKGVNDVGKSPTIETVTLSTSSWTGTSSPYTQTVAVNGIQSDPSLQIILVSPYPDAGNVETIANCNAYCTGQGTDTLTFTAYEDKPTVAITFNVSIQNL